MPFDSQPSDANKYISETLLSPGAWQESGEAPVRATVNYTYTLPRCLFNLNVSEAALRQQDETTTPIVLFSGNFSYDLASLTVDERLKALYKALENWQVDLETYSDTINNKFLVQPSSVPSVIPDALIQYANVG